MRLRWGGLEREAVGAWDRLAAQVREHDGTSIISHEILATASRTQVQRALASLGHEPGGTGGTEVHLIVSVRDLVRQIPAEWQENVKHRATFSYAQFLDRIRDPERGDRVGAWFWGVQEIPDILHRWGATIPPERVHIVTVPRPGGPREEPVAALQHRLRPARPRPGARHRAGQPESRRARVRPAAPDQQGRDPRPAAGALPPPRARACWPTRPCRSGRGRRG
ncbi:hypothetical protein [Nocardioides convexus]|uniref:hypothetical protein n=1 Tax=Nocardioides convexus TaxID=2712224 RepID=UPI002418170B|nr:hypothetical protein [Nocardioides convexus]